MGRRQRRVSPENYVEIVRKKQSKDYHPFLFKDYHEINVAYCDSFGYPKDNSAERYIHHRYTDVLTLRQQPFSLPLEEHPHPYPAAKIDISDTVFNVLAEGPFKKNLDHLLWGLKQVEINSLVAVGLPFERHEKYYNYMNDGVSLTAEEYFQAIAPDQKINFSSIQRTQFTFYRYKSSGFGNFYVLHIPNWEDHGLPIFNEADKAVLAYFFSYGPNSCFHCSAGFGRSVALMLANMIFKTMRQDWSNLDEAREMLKSAFVKVKTVKPGAGEKEQYAIVPGLVEDVRGICADLKLERSNEHVQGSQEKKGVPPFRLPLENSDNNDQKRLPKKGVPPFRLPLENSDNNDQKRLPKKGVPPFRLPLENSDNNDQKRLPKKGVPPFQFRLKSSDNNDQKQLPKKRVPPFRLPLENSVDSSQETVEGFPAEETIVADTSQMYSGHLPQLFNIRLGKTTMNLMTYNICAQAGACGYSAYDEMENEEITSALGARKTGENKPIALYSARLQRIAASIGSMVTNHDIHGVAIQEGVSSGFAKFFEGEIKKFGFKALYQDRQWFLYNPKFFKNATQIERKDSKKFGQVAGSVQRVFLQISSKGWFPIYNVHMTHQDVPRFHQHWLQDVHDTKNGLVLTLGDFNAGVMPFRLTRRVPSVFTAGQEAYDSTDGCVMSSQDVPAKFVRGDVIDPRSGRIITAPTRFSKQPDERRYRACILLEGNMKAILRHVMQMEPNITGIMSVYDIQLGKEKFAFLVRGTSLLFSLLVELGLMESHQFLDSVTYSNGYIVESEKLTVFSKQSELSALVTSLISHQLSHPMFKGQTNFLNAAAALSKEISTSLIKLCQFAKILILIQKSSHSVSEKKKALDQYRGPRSIFSSFISMLTPEEKKRDTFVCLAKELIDSASTNKNDDPYGFDSIRI